MPVGSAEPEGRHRRSAPEGRAAPIEEFRWDRSSEAGEIDVVVQPWGIFKLVVLTPPIIGKWMGFFKGKSTPETHGFLPHGKITSKYRA